MYMYMYYITCVIGLLRSGNYTLNLSAGSDGDMLLTSPGREKDVQQQDNGETGHSTGESHNPSTSHDQKTTPSSNGIAGPSSSSDSSSSPKGERTVLNSNENCSERTETNATGSVNSEAGKTNSEGTIGQLPDGEVTNEEELQDNFR